MINNEKNLFQKVNKNYYLIFLSLVMFVLVMSLNIGGVFGAEVSNIIDFVDGTDYSSAWLEFVRERVINNGDETRSQLWNKIQQDNDKINLIRDLFTKDIYTGVSGEGEEANLLFKSLTLEQRKEVIKLITGEDNLPIKGLESEDLTLESLDENLILKHKNGAYFDLDALPDLKKGVDIKAKTETFVKKSPGKYSLELKEQSINYKLKSVEYTDDGLVYTYETTLNKEKGEVKINLQGIGTIKANGEYTNENIKKYPNIFSPEKKINLLAGTKGQITVTQNGLINLDNGAVMKYGEHSIRQMMSVANKDKKAGYQNYVPNNDKLKTLARQGKSDETGVVDIAKLGINPPQSLSPVDSEAKPKFQNIILDSEQGRFFFSRKRPISFIDYGDVFENQYPTGPYIQIISEKNGITLKGKSDNYIGFIANAGQYIKEINVKNSKGQSQIYGWDKKSQAVYTYGAFYFRNGDLLQKTYQDETSTYRGNQGKAAANVGKIEKVGERERVVDKGIILRGKNKYLITEVNGDESVTYSVKTDDERYITKKTVVHTTAIPQREATKRMEKINQRVGQIREQAVKAAAQVEISKPITETPTTTPETTTPTQETPTTSQSGDTSPSVEGPIQDPVEIVPTTPVNKPPLTIPAPEGWKDDDSHLKISTSNYQPTRRIAQRPRLKGFFRRWS